MMTMSCNSTHAEQQLEKALQQATKSPVYQTLFYRLLLDARVYILTDEMAGDVTPLSGQKLSIQHWEMLDKTKVIPFFSSVAKLQQTMVDQQAGSATLLTHELFSMSQGVQLFLNPKSEYGKLFYPEEVAMLLQTGAMSPVVDQYTEVGEEIWLGQPEVYPSAMVAALVALFTQRHNVRSAYLALLQVRVQDDRPNLLVALEVEGTQREINVLIQEVGSLASSAILQEETVDIIVISDDTEEAVSVYLTQHTQPFYQRRWGSWLRYAIPHHELG